MGTVTGGAVDRFLHGIETGRVSAAGAFADAAELDATVPHWRFTVRGGDAIGAELDRWYATAGSFEDLRRVPAGQGEIVEYTLTWSESGVPHAVHQIHVLSVSDDRIVSDRVWCGGRWDATLLAQMAEASDVA